MSHTFHMLFTQGEWCNNEETLLVSITIERSLQANNITRTSACTHLYPYKHIQI